MEIRYQDIVLRDMKKSDIEDWVRWFTVETAWMDWDGPDISRGAFDDESYRKRASDELYQPEDVPRTTFEIETTDGKHLGKLVSYMVDENWKPLHNPDCAGGCYGPVLGICLCESGYWGRSYGRKALTAFVEYLIKQGNNELYLKTWSGNFRMVRCAQRIGFREYERTIGNRHIRGEVYDSLTFKLDLDIFHNYLAENT